MKKLPQENHQLKRKLRGTKIFPIDIACSFMNQLLETIVLLRPCQPLLTSYNPFKDEGQRSLSIPSDLEIWYKKFEKIFLSLSSMNCMVQNYNFFFCFLLSHFLPFITKMGVPRFLNCVKNQFHVFGSNFRICLMVRSLSTLL